MTPAQNKNAGRNFRKVVGCAGAAIKHGAGKSEQPGSKRRRDAEDAVLADDAKSACLLDIDLAHPRRLRGQSHHLGESIVRRSRPRESLE